MEKKRILIVDDEKDTATVLGMFIEKIGQYEVHLETDGSQAYAAAKQFKPDLLLLDIMMPGVDGGEVASQIKADADTKDIPIVFVSGAITKDEAREQGSTLGGYPVLAKPVRKKELIKVLEKYFVQGPISEENSESPMSEPKPSVLASDRRIHARVKANTELSYVCLDKDDNPQRTGTGKAINISKSGLQLKTSLPIDSDYLQMTISDVEDECVNIKGKVIYSNELEPHLFQTGVSFIGPEEKCHQFVVNLIRSSSRTTKLHTT